jgi:hypothetical protein
MQKAEGKTAYEFFENSCFCLLPCAFFLQVASFFSNLLTTCAR